MGKEDLKYFTVAETFGGVYLADPLAGKTVLDVYRDGDQNIVDEHFKTLTFYCADFEVTMGPTTTPEALEEKLSASGSGSAKTKPVSIASVFIVTAPRR